ncbi:Lrp/AsnC ligand binding domain-containing protein [Candidatus Bathyarchaeota archaeon]|nr:Lrp/AsnC ligand binding domain-containing protein [Candidatus Bathyarchaeota archaeon]
MPVGAYILFKVASGNEREALEKIANLPEVHTVGMVYGEYDLIAKITVPTLHSLEDFMAKKISKIPSIILTSTMVIAQEHKGKSQHPKK